MQAAQDITIGARLSKTQYQYTLVDVDSDELNHWAPILLQKLQALPQLTDVASDQQSAGRTLKIEVNREVASRLGINPSVVDSILYDAFGQRHVGADLHHAERVLRHPRSRTRLPARAERAQPHLCDVGQRDPGTAEPVRYDHLDRSHRLRSTTRASSRR